MGRPKKNNNVQVQEKKGSAMNDTPLATLETDIEKTLTELDLARIELSKIQKEIEEGKVQAKKNREISAEEKVIIDKQLDKIEQSIDVKNKMDQQKAYDKELVTGRFLNRRAPGQPVKLPYIKYADDPVKWHPFQDGKVYTIPRGFADQINEHYHTPIFVQKHGEMDPNKPESTIEEVDTSNKKYSFVPVNF